MEEVSVIRINCKKYFFKKKKSLDSLLQNKFKIHKNIYLLDKDRQDWKLKRKALTNMQNNKK